MVNPFFPQLIAGVLDAGRVRADHRDDAIVDADQSIAGGEDGCRTCAST